MIVFKILFSPFALIYALITEMRNLLYNLNIMRPNSFDLPVISLGNLSTGGTGKSPHTEYLIRLLTTTKKVAVLSRGFGRGSSDFREVLSDDQPSASGDEPLQFKTSFPNTGVFVDGDRVRGITRLLYSYPDTQVVLLDDAFQHRAVKPGLQILLTDYNHPFYTDFILPVGTLREIRKNVKRADVILMTKSPKSLEEKDKSTIKKIISRYTNVPVYFSSVNYSDLSNGITTIQPGSLKQYDVVLVTGIAKPEGIEKYFNTFAKSVTHLKYRDHYRYSKSDVLKIQGVYKQLISDQKIIVTTRKDYMRLYHQKELKNEWNNSSDLFIQDIKVEIDNSKEFNEIIEKYVRENT